MITCGRLLVFLSLFLLPGVQRSGIAAGVTVITHGFNGNVDDWVLEMAGNIPHHPDFQGTSASLYRVSVTKPGGAFYLASESVGPSNPLSSSSGEIVIAWDWSTLAGLFQESTATIAGQLAAALLATNLIPQLDGRALAQLPLHLVGHSRGASLMAETARVLGAQGVWVDHLTTLDPYPLSFNSDPAMKNYANVFFADNYWQNQHFPDGESVAGAYNRYLTALAGGYDDTASSHSDVHLWYHGTVDLRTPTGDPNYFVEAPQRSGWWTALESGGTNAGFRFSAIARGDRFSPLEPNGTGNGRINDGVNRHWDLGLGTAANRSALPQNNGAWPNLIRCNTEPLQLTVGDSLACGLHYQFGASPNAPAADVTLYLDLDLNPFNGNQIQLHAGTLVATGRDLVSTATLAGTIPGTAIPGDYWPFCSIRTGDKTRFLYAAQPVKVIGVSLPLIITDPRMTDVSFVCTIHGPVNGRAVLEATTDFAQWIPLQTNTLSGGSAEFSAPLRAEPGAWLFRARRLP